MQTNSRRWRKIREIFLTAHPFCVECAKQGITAFATDVDHKDGDATNDTVENYQGLCKSCHSRKTRLETIGDKHGTHGEASQR